MKEERLEIHKARLTEELFNLEYGAVVDINVGNILKVFIVRTDYKHFNSYMFTLIKGDKLKTQEITEDVNHIIMTTAKLLAMADVQPLALHLI